MAKKITEKKQATISPSQFPPVVTVLGHVDHGKTTLLDAFRKTSVADREHGGITQKIGASSVELLHDKVKRRITLIDTPGHAAFFRMRGRGVQVADVALLVVSLVDGVKPQTKESIELLKESKIPFIVVLTKSDADTKNPEKVKGELLKEQVMLEGLGGDVPFMEVSAKTGRNIQALLELILLVFDMKHDAASLSPDALVSGVIIESKMDMKAGPRVTVIIKNGTLKISDELRAGDISGRVRTIMDDKGVHLKTATIGDGVEILGFQKAPPVGSFVMNKKSLNNPVQEVKISESVKEISGEEKPMFQQRAEDKRELSIILCTDTYGSLEAITESLPSTVRIVSQKTGEVTVADVLMGKSTGAIVLGFNIKLKPEIVRLAITEKVPVKNYTIIYELIDEIKDVLEGKKLALEEPIYGTAKIIASFPFDKTKVLGVQVLDGRIAKGDRVRVMRGEVAVGESTLTSLRQGKDATSKVEKGNEAGIVLTPFLDFTIGDMVICHG